MTQTNIYKKLLAFQKLGITVKKDGKNPHFKSNYATLNEVLDKVKKPLNDMGVLIVFCTKEDGLTTRLIDTESETEVGAFMKYVNCDNPQKLLSCNTYYRRGTLVSLLGLEDEDEDGNIASQPQAPAYIDNPIDKIKATKNRIELIALYNSMPATQQKAEHIINAMTTHRQTFKTT